MYNLVGNVGAAHNQLYNPYGIALHPTTNTLYIADFNNHRIMSYAKGATSGTLLLGGQGIGTNNTQVSSPVGLYLDLFTNSLVITNYGAHNIVRYVLGTNSWSLIAGDINGIQGTIPTRLSYPTDAILDPMGSLYVADRDNNRIQFFYDNHFNGTTIAGITGVSNLNGTTLNGPRSLTLDNQLNLYVADANNNRIQKFFRY